MALRVLRAVRGVREVEENILVRPADKRDDSEIARDVRARLLGDVRVSRYDFDVQVEDAEVTLEGVVGCPAAKERAVADAWVAGVRSVDSESLEVDPAVCEEMVRKKPPQLKDDQIRQAVRDAMQYDPRVPAAKIEVTVEDGAVTLHGDVPNFRAKQAGKQAALSTTGVELVYDHVKVRPEETLTDKEIEKRVDERLDQEPQLQDLRLEVEVVNGKVYVRGEVPSLIVKRFLGRVISDVQGVEALGNHTSIRTPRTEQQDLKLLRRIQRELYWNPYVEAENVTVQVKDGVATLAGEVDSWAARSEAELMALQAGASRVRNRLELRAWTKQQQ
jgi:osmotically-inducible protein OsmY